MTYHPYSAGSKDPNTRWNQDVASGFRPPDSVAVHTHPGSEILSGALPTGMVAGNAIIGTGNTASTSYADVPGPFEVAFVKRLNSTVINVTVLATTYMSVAGANVFLAVRINGVDHDVARHFFNAANVHLAMLGMMDTLAGLPAGAYTARLRWKVDGGTANTDVNDSASLRVEETAVL